MKEKLSKLVNVYKKYGFRGFWRKLWAYFVAYYWDTLGLQVRFRPGKYRALIETMLSGDYDRIILWRSSSGFQVPLFQRPQHISRQLARGGSLVIYEVTSMTDALKTLKEQEERLWLFNFKNAPLSRLLTQALVRVEKPKYVQIYSTNWEHSLGEITAYGESGCGLIYEYIDHISPELSGTSMLPKNVSDKYDYAMTHEDVYVVVTAELLRRDAVAHRGSKRLAYSTNGVDYDFFQHFDAPYAFEAEFQAVLERGKPIVCYYGALAKWFDYELVKKIAATGKYSVVLFGVKYDESFDEQLREAEDVFFLGARDYAVLKYYAREADVLMIPFLINDITRSTSPVKIFEYMALHKPIVTTDMNECRQYKSVLIGHDHEEFLAQLDRAMALRGDADYLALLDCEARENDWSMKARAITDMLAQDETGGTR